MEIVRRMLAAVARVGGYDPALVVELDLTRALHLALQGAAVGLSASLYTVSAFHAVSLSTGSALAGAIGGIGVGFFLFHLQRLVIAGGGYGCADPIGGLVTWRPSRAGPLLIALFAVAFAQPLVVWGRRADISRALDARLTELVALHTSSLEAEFDDRAHRAERERAGTEALLEQLRARRLQLGPGAASSTPRALDGQAHRNFGGGTEGDRPPTARLKHTVPTGESAPAPALGARTPPVAEARGRRRALLFGVQSNPGALLNNPAKDVEDLGRKLRALEFDVSSHVDVEKRAMVEAIDAYVRALRPGDISLFFYSGHGLQEGGENYMIPVDFGTGGASLDKRAQAVTTVVVSIDGAHPLVNVVILDACRSGMGPNGSASMGLAKREAGRGTLIALASAPGTVARDGAPNTNGVFTGALLDWIDKPLDVETLFRKVREQVNAATQGAQLPWTSSSVLGEIILARPERASPLATTPAPSAGDGAPPEAVALVVGARVAAMDEAEVDRQTQRAEARVAALNQRLTAIGQERETALGDDLDAYRRRMTSAGFFGERVEMAWHKPWLSILLTIVFGSMLCAAPVLRRLMIDATVAYESLHFHASRAIVQTSFAHAKLIIAARLANEEALDLGIDDDLTAFPFDVAPVAEVTERVVRGDEAVDGLLAALGMT